MKTDQLITAIERHLVDIDRPKSWLCTKLNVSTQTFNNWRTRGIPTRHLEAIAEVFEWNYTELVLGRITPTTGIVNIPLFTPNSSHNETDHSDEQGAFLLSISVSRSWLKRNLNFSNPKNLCIIPGKSTLFQSTYDSDDSLLIDKGINSFTTDGVYLLSSSNDYFIKRVEKMINGSIQVSNDNQDYKPYSMPSEEFSAITVVAKVIWSLSGKAI